MDLLILFLLLLIIIICLIVATYAYLYNKFQDVIIRINEVEATIDTNLRNKYDLLNKSISIIKGNVKIEDDIFDEIVKLRSRKISNFDLDRKLILAFNEFNSVKSQNKELNKSEELNKIEKDIEDIDNKLTTFREYYNENITKYNRLVKAFPTNIIALTNKYEEKLFFDRKDMNDEDYNDFKL